jgi:hypothetical protein
MRRALVMSAAFLALGASTLIAQAKPNFAGKWTAVVDPNAPPPQGRGGRGGGMAGLGQEATIAQDAKTLTVTRTTQAGETKSVYNLDGSESKNTLTMGGNAIEVSSKATWEGDKLVITSSMNFNGNPVETKMVLAMAGADLSVESTSPGRGGGAPTTTTRTYKKG